MRKRLGKPIKGEDYERWTKTCRAGFGPERLTEVKRWVGVVPITLIASTLYRYLFFWGSR